MYLNISVSDDDLRKLNKVNTQTSNILIIVVSSLFEISFHVKFPLHLIHGLLMEKKMCFNT